MSNLMDMDSMAAGLGIIFTPISAPPQETSPLRKLKPYAPALRNQTSNTSFGSTATSSRRVRIISGPTNIIDRPRDDVTDYGTPSTLNSTIIMEDEGHKPLKEHPLQRTVRYGHARCTSEQLRPISSKMVRPKSMMNLPRVTNPELSGTAKAPQSIARHARSYSSNDIFTAKHLVRMRSESNLKHADELEEGAHLGLPVKAAVRVLAQDFAPALTGSLRRQGTLISSEANSTRHSKELSNILAPSTASNKNDSPLKRRQSTVILEQGKSKRRVELDVTLISSAVVEGGLLSGQMSVSIRPGKTANEDVWIARPKARIVGFEETTANSSRHVFYHHSADIEATSGTGVLRELPCFDSTEDEEGYYRGKTGTHTFPFELRLPLDKGAKGSLQSKVGIIRYIVIGSIKLKSREGDNRSIAHFYRQIDVYPYLNPSITLAPSPLPLTANSSKALVSAAAGKIELSATIHRSIWVAGQRCYIDVTIQNSSSKKVKTLCFNLSRTTTTYRPRDTNTVDVTDDPAAYHITETRKKVAEETLEVGQKGLKGVATAKGMWMGAQPGETVRFSQSMHLPAEELSISRSRFIEVTYALKVAVSGEVFVELPIRIVNFMSLDPPPGHISTLPVQKLPSPLFEPKNAPIPQMAISEASSEYYKPASNPTSYDITRMSSLDTLRLYGLDQGYLHRGNHIPSPEYRISQPSPTYSDQTSSTELSTPSSVEMTRDYSRPPSSYFAATQDELLHQQEQRRLRHRMSLESIGSAIASATARRQAGVSSQEHSPLDPHGPASYARYQLHDKVTSLYSPVSQHASVEGSPITSIEESPEESMIISFCGDDASTVEEGYYDDSDDEIDIVLQNAHFGEYEDKTIAGSTPHLSPIIVSPTESKEFDLAKTIRSATGHPQYQDVQHKSKLYGSPHPVVRRKPVNYF